MAFSWSISPAAGKHQTVAAQHPAAMPLQARSAVNDLMQLFGSNKTFALSSSGTVNADGTGTATVTITVT